MSNSVNTARARPPCSRRPRPSSAKRSRSRSRNAPRTPRAQRERTEREIEKLEGQLAALDAESEANATDYQKLMELDAQKQTLNAQLEALYEAWEALCE